MSLGVHKSVEAFDTITNLLRNTQSSNYNLISNISRRLLIPLQKYFQEDFKELKDSRKNFDKFSEKYDGILHRYYSLSKFKDVSELDNVKKHGKSDRVDYVFIRFASCRIWSNFMITELLILSNILIML